MSETFSGGGEEEGVVFQELKEDVKQINQEVQKKALIRAFNDRLRKTFEGGKILMTSGVAALEEETRFKVLRAIQAFDDFNEGNDSYGEHDFIPVEVEGERYFGKIDYYDKDSEMGSEDPSDEEVTERILTVMQAEEY